MGDSSLAVKVQTIGVIDALITALMLAALIFQGGVTLWDKTDATHETGVQMHSVHSSFKKQIQLFLEGKNISNESIYSTHFVWTWTPSASTKQTNADLRFWWRIVHNVFVGLGLGLLIGAALALIRSTSLKITPKKAEELVRVWFCGCILLVLMITLSISGMLVSTNFRPGPVGSLGGILIYLSVRVMCMFIVRRYLWDLNKQIHPLIGDSDGDTKESA